MLNMFGFRIVLVGAALGLVACSQSGDSGQVQPLAVDGTSMNSRTPEAAPSNPEGRPVLTPALFPTEAEGQSGTVQVTIKVRDGRVLSASVRGGTAGIHPAFIREALKAAREAQFPPDFTGERVVPYEFKSF